MKKVTDRNGCNIGHKVDFFNSVHLELVRLERELASAASEKEAEIIESRIISTMNRAGIPTAEQVNDKSAGRYGGVFGYDGDAAYPPKFPA